MADLTQVCAKLVRDFKDLTAAVAAVHKESGPAGSDGSDGDPGERGKRGPQGDAGPSGTDGRDGRDGRNGLDGKDGVGEPGTDGVDGRDGGLGGQGLRGETGRGGKGDKGDQGVRGRKGDRGADSPTHRFHLKGANLIQTTDGVETNLGRVKPIDGFRPGNDTGGGGRGVTGVSKPDPPVTVTEDYVVANSELIIIDATAQDINIDLSNPVRDKYKFKRKDGSGFTGSFGVAVIDGDTTFKLLWQDETATLERDGLVWWIT